MVLKVKSNGIVWRKASKAEGWPKRNPYKGTVQTCSLPLHLGSQRRGKGLLVVTPKKLLRKLLCLVTRRQQL